MEILKKIELYIERHEQKVCERMCVYLCVEREREREKKMIFVYDRERETDWQRK